MPEQTTCPECGATLPAGAPHGLCPRCLLIGEASEHPKPDDAEPSGGQAEQSTVPISVPVSEKPGDRIGRYKLLQKLGEGGCGIVYMAEQEEPVKRRVALKVIKLGMDTKEVIARFEAERQALALMDHPNIAKVLDGGATDTGGPYFVMELVRGIPITKYCDENRLDTTQRLELFILICQAIQHAHQKGIIHRDIKPSNMLVADHDGVPVPKVIDFGIAKAIAGQTLTDKTLFTAFEQFIGTPAYMSPEQAKLSGLDIDTRSDVYSLGVLLYELLTGKTPFEPKRLIQAGIEEICRIIREEEPPRPSTRLSTLEAAEQTTLARQRQIEAPKLVHLMRGDLDWIVMKTLEKDRNRRYETANGLAMDLRRFLNNEPVLACPPSNAYRIKKLVQRHRLAVTSALAVSLALALGLGLSTWLFIKERVARQRVASEATKSQQVAQFLTDMLSGVGPSAALGRDTAVLREILDQTAERVGKELAGQPSIEAELRSTLGEVYRALGELGKAEAMHRKALRIRQQLLGNEHVEVAASLHCLSRTLWNESKLSEAENLSREALGLRRKLLGTLNAEVAETLNILASIVWSQGHLPEAENLERETLSIRRQLWKGDAPAVAESLDNLSLLLTYQDKLVEAETLGREAVAMNRRLLQSNDPELAASLNNLAVALMSAGKLGEAETVCREALMIRRKVLGEKHPDLVATLSNLGTLLQRQGKLAEAESEFREAVKLAKERLGNRHLDVVLSLNNLALVLRDEAKYAEAESAYREALEIATNVVGKVHSYVATPLGSLAGVLQCEGKLPEAEAAIRECIEIREKLAPDHWRTAGARLTLGSILLEQKKDSEAEPALLSAFNALEERKATIPTDAKARFKEVLLRVVRLYETTTRPDSAAEWKKRIATFDKSDLSP